MYNSKSANPAERVIVPAPPSQQQQHQTAKGLGGSAVSGRKLSVTFSADGGFAPLQSNTATNTNKGQPAAFQASAAGTATIAQKNGGGLHPPVTSASPSFTTAAATSAKHGIVQAFDVAHHTKAMAEHEEATAARYDAAGKPLLAAKALERALDEKVRFLTHTQQVVSGPTSHRADQHLLHTCGLFGSSGSGGGSFWVGQSGTSTCAGCYGNATGGGALLTAAPLRSSSRAAAGGGGGTRPPSAASSVGQKQQRSRSSSPLSMQRSTSPPVGNAPATLAAAMTAAEKRPSIVSVVSVGSAVVASPTSGADGDEAAQLPHAPTSTASSTPAALTSTATAAVPRWASSLTRPQHQFILANLGRARATMDACDGLEAMGTIAERIVLRYNKCAMDALGGGGSTSSGGADAPSSSSASVASALDYIQRAMGFLKPSTLALYEESLAAGANGDHADDARDGTPSSSPPSLLPHYPATKALLEQERILGDFPHLVSLLGCPPLPGSLTAAVGTADTAASASSPSTAPLGSAANKENSLSSGEQHQHQSALLAIGKAQHAMPLWELMASGYGVSTLDGSVSALAAALTAPTTGGGGGGPNGNAAANGRRSFFSGGAVVGSRPSSATSRAGSSSPVRSGSTAVAGPSSTVPPSRLGSAQRRRDLRSATVEAATALNSAANATPSSPTPCSDYLNNAPHFAVFNNTLRQTQGMLFNWYFSAPPMANSIDAGGIVQRAADEERRRLVAAANAATTADDEGSCSVVVGGGSATTRTSSAVEASPSPQRGGGGFQYPTYATSLSSSSPQRLRNSTAAGGGATSSSSSSPAANTAAAPAVTTTPGLSTVHALLAAVRLARLRATTLNNYGCILRRMSAAAAATPSGAADASADIVGPSTHNANSSTTTIISSNSSASSLLKDAIACIKAAAAIEVRLTALMGAVVKHVYGARSAAMAKANMGLAMGTSAGAAGGNANATSANTTSSSSSNNKAALLLQQQQQQQQLQAASVGANVGIAAVLGLDTVHTPQLIELLEALGRGSVATPTNPSSVSVPSSSAPIGIRSSSTAGNANAGGANTTAATATLPLTLATITHSTPAADAARLLSDDHREVAHRITNSYYTALRALQSAAEVPLCTPLTNLSSLYVQLGRYSEGLGLASEAVAALLTFEKFVELKAQKAAQYAADKHHRQQQQQEAAGAMLTPKRPSPPTVKAAAAPSPLLLGGGDDGSLLLTRVPSAINVYNTAVVTVGEGGGGGGGDVAATANNTTSAMLLAAGIGAGSGAAAGSSVIGANSNTNGIPSTAPFYNSSKIIDTAAPHRRHHHPYRGLGAIVFQNLAIALEPSDPQGALEAYAVAIRRAKAEEEGAEEEREEGVAAGALNKTPSEGGRLLSSVIAANRDRFAHWLQQRYDGLVASVYGGGGGGFGEQQWGAPNNSALFNGSGVPPTAASPYAASMFGGSRSPSRYGGGRPSSARSRRGGGAPSVGGGGGGRRASSVSGAASAASPNRTSAVMRGGGGGGLFPLQQPNTTATTATSANDDDQQLLPLPMGSHSAAALIASGLVAAATINAGGGTALVGTAASSAAMNASSAPQQQQQQGKGSSPTALRAAVASTTILKAQMIQTALGGESGLSSYSYSPQPNPNPANATAQLDGGDTTIIVSGDGAQQQHQGAHNHNHNHHHHHLSRVPPTHAGIVGKMHRLERYKEDHGYEPLTIKAQGSDHHTTTGTAVAATANAGAADAGGTGASATLADPLSATTAPSNSAAASSAQQQQQQQQQPSQPMTPMVFTPSSTTAAAVVPPSRSASARNMDVASLRRAAATAAAGRKKAAAGAGNGGDGGAATSYTGSSSANAMQASASSAAPSPTNHNGHVLPSEEEGAIGSPYRRPPHRGGNRSLHRNQQQHDDDDKGGAAADADLHALPYAEAMSSLDATFAALIVERYTPLQHVGYAINKKDIDTVSAALAANATMMMMGGNGREGSPSGTGGGGRRPSAVGPSTLVPRPPMGSSGGNSNSISSPLRSSSAAARRPIGLSSASLKASNSSVVGGGAMNMTPSRFTGGGGIGAYLSSPSSPAAAGGSSPSTAQQQQQHIALPPRDPRPLAPMPVSLLEEARRGDDLLQLLVSRLNGLLRHEDNYHYKYVRARRIQCLWRCVMAKDELRRRRHLRALRDAQLLKTRNRASTRISTFFRGIITRREEEEAARRESLRVATEEYDASVVLQKYARRWIANRRCDHLREKHNKRVRDVTVVQRLAREHRARRIASEQRQWRANEAALSLQRETEHAAAAKIQAQMRAHWEQIHHVGVRLGRPMAALRMDRQKYRLWAVVTMQRLVRGFLARAVHGARVRHVIKVCRNKRSAARRRAAQIVIASAWRGYAIRRQSSPYGLVASRVREGTRRRRDAMREAAATLIQTRIRMFLARRAFVRLRVERIAVLETERQQVRLMATDRTFYYPVVTGEMAFK